MEFVARSADGRTVHYRDPKRYAWLAAFIGPFLGIATVFLYFATGAQPWVLFVPLAYVFVLIPIVDGLFGEDSHNPPDAIVPLLAADPYYRALLYADIFLLYVSFIASVWLVGTQSIPWWAYIGFALSVGITSADAILLGHELGHKQSALDRAAAQVALALVGYGHFSVEHNRGHHVQVATPEDSASARMGESVYRFVLREIPGGLRRGWCLTAAIAAALIATFGWRIAPFLVIHHLYAWYGLTQANYVEHYGLLRQKLSTGRYETPAPRHSWNTNHIFSNIMSFHLQRHSDHHANVLRPYQALRDFDDLPRLPSGYPGCFGLAMFPKAWFKVMDPKLLDCCGGDLHKANIDPKKRAALFARYGQIDAPPG